MDDLDWVDAENSSFEVEETLWKRLESLRFKDGFKDGTVEGGERALQMGFNLGYKQTIKQLYQVAKVKGVIMNVIEQMQADGMSHQMQNETDALRQELGEDWTAYVTHLKNTNIPSIKSLSLSAGLGTSCSDEIEVTSSSVEDNIPSAMDGSCLKSEPEMSLFPDSTLGRLSSDVAPSEINSLSKTQTVDNSYLKKLFDAKNCSEETKDHARSSVLHTAEDNTASTVIAASTAIAAADELTEYKVPVITSTESTIVKSMSNEDNQDPCDIMSVLAHDLHLHTDELDRMGKSFSEKYLLKLEILLRKWKTE